MRGTVFCEWHQIAINEDAGCIRVSDGSFPKPKGEVCQIGSQAYEKFRRKPHGVGEHGVKPGALKKVGSVIYNPQNGQYIPLIYCLLGDYISSTTYSGNQKQLLSGTWVPNVQKRKKCGEKKHVFWLRIQLFQVFWIINNIKFLHWIFSIHITISTCFLSSLQRFNLCNPFHNPKKTNKNNRTLNTSLTHACACPWWRAMSDGLQKQLNGTFCPKMIHKVDKGHPFGCGQGQANTQYGGQGDKGAPVGQMAS